MVAEVVVEKAAARRVFVLVAVLAFVALELGYQLGAEHIWRAAEQRCNAVVNEMYRSGDWLVPRMGPTEPPRLQKPPLFYWAATVAAKLAGGPSVVTLRSVSLLAGLGLVAAVFVWGFVWHTRWGYELRVVGANPQAALYAGISPQRNIVLAMAISGALAGLLGVNEIMGVNHRLLLNFTAGYGFVGIAVSLMGRSHPVGIVLASLLFGALYQGGTELAFEVPRVSREIVVVIQGLVILFAGALEFLFLPLLRPLLRAP